MTVTTFLISIVVLHLSITLFFAWKITLWKSYNQYDEPFFSIIIAARNELEKLKALVPALLDQQYPHFEIIVGLDRCEDSSQAYLDSLSEKRISYVILEKVPFDWNPKKYTLNEAIKIAKGEWLALTDADCLPNSNEWLSSIKREIKEEVNVIIGISPHVAKATLLSNYVRFEVFMTSFLYSAFCMFGKPYMGVGRNMAIRKSFFKENDGYHSIKSILGGDDDLFIQKSRRKNGVRLMLGSKTLMITSPPDTWNNYFSQKIRHFSVSAYYALSDQLTLSLYHLSHLAMIILGFFYTDTNHFLLIIFFYLFIKLVSYSFAAVKMESGFNYILLPFVDIMYALLTPVMSIRSKLIKDIKWKN